MRTTTTKSLEGFAPAQRAYALAKALFETTKAECDALIGEEPSLDLESDHPDVVAWCVLAQAVRDARGYYEQETALRTATSALIEWSIGESEKFAKRTLRGAKLKEGLESLAFVRSRSTYPGTREKLVDMAMRLRAA